RDDVGRLADATREQPRVLEDRQLQVGVAGAGGDGGEGVACGEVGGRARWNVLVDPLGGLETRAHLTGQSPLCGPSSGADPFRNGLVARSRPMVVCSPCPGSTAVSSGNDRHTRARLSMIVV